MFKNKNSYPKLFLLVFLLFNTICFSQNTKKKNLTDSIYNSVSEDYYEDHYQNDSIRYEDYVYNASIKTVQLRDESFELSQPILNLDSQEKLKLSFDDLDADLKNYSYTIIHCSSNWQPSDLMPADYIEGFQDNAINDYRYSANTLQKYTHYNAVFPNNSMRITKSGNYILKVYLADSPDNIIITKRFMVYQNKIIIKGKVNAASIIADRNFKQEIDFTINYSDYTITNPFADLKVAITQNNRWDNAKTTLKPSLVNDTELVYNFDEDNVFSGGSEFRNFDIKSLHYQSPRIAQMKVDSAGNQIILLPDEKRGFKRYSSNTDINGNYLIKIQEGTNSEVEADYCYVHFFLPYNEVLTDGNLYVFGAYNGWKCNSENVLKYNEKHLGYETTLYLKQGYYNYEYVFLKNGDTVADETLIEGMHYETENDYAIYVYHQQQGTFYDQLIGVARLNSMRNN